ncbi:MAG TPA: alpha/beta fold hydrolase [Candidatus Limnocylindrales bacterium]
MTSRASLAAVLFVVGITTTACLPQAVPPSPPAVATPTPRPSATGPSSAPTIAPPKLARWSDCGRGFQCATVDAPLDYGDPSLGSIGISIVRHAAEDPRQRIGSLVVNPGGPGGSGVEFVRDGIGLFTQQLLRRFDLVGFDPRGVSLSAPVRCIDNLDPRVQLDPSPDDAAELRELVSDAESYATACGDRNERLLPHVSTDAVVEDLDRIRAALGEETLTYLGFSYGTLIGARYADRFPDRIRAFALDGALDPSLSLAKLRAGQAVGFEGALNRFLASCAGRRNCPFGHGSGTAGAFDRLMRRIDDRSLRAIRIRDPRRVGPGLAWSAVLGSMYQEAAWPSLEIALALAERGDGSGFLALSDPYRGRDEHGAYSNMQDAYTANICLDYPASTVVGDYTNLARSLRAAAPRFASLVAYEDLACAFWPTPSTGRPTAVRAAGAPPIVVVGTTGDPATPYGWSVALAKQLETGVLVTHRGEGHTAFGTSDCVRRVLTTYLVDIQPPRNATVCR